MAWTIRGDADVTVTTVAGVTYGLNNTERTFEDMGITSWQLKFASMADDFFTYTIRTKNAKGLGAIVPRDGQEIHVYYNGVRKFKGHVVKPMLGLSTLKVTAYGPWWWMGQINLSGAAVDGAGVSAQRTSYKLPAQGIRASLRALNNRAVTMGVPMANITDGDENDRISSMFEFLETTLSNMSFAAAMAEFLGYVPDAVTWFDYEPTPPKLYIGRRGSLTGITYAVGATGTTRVESAEIHPRTDQKVQRMELYYMRREAVNHRPRWATQAHGSVSTATHKRQIQIVTISGPETVAFLPPDDLDTRTLKTKVCNFGTADYFDLDPVLKRAKIEYGKFLGNAAALNFSGWHRILSGETAEWMVKDQGMTRKTIKVAGWVTGTYAISSGLGFGGLGKCAGQLKALGRLSYNIGGTSPSGFGDFKLYVEFQVEAINLSYPVATVVRKSPTHDFILPPAGLAEDLRDAQNWIPWEGSVTMILPDLTGYNGVQRKFNLSNSHPDHDTMDALVKSVTYEGGRNRVRWELGAPARTDLGSLVNKMRRNPQDNIRVVTI